MEMAQVHMVGRKVAAVFLIDGSPCNMSGVVRGLDPFQFETANRWAKDLDPGTRALFVYQEGQELHKASTRVSFVKEDDGLFFVDTSTVLWESVDRRRHVRRQVEVPVAFKFVQDSDGDVRMEACDGLTIDLSAGGSCVSYPKPPPVGTLVDCAFVLGSSAPSRALGVVAWIREASGEFGVEFLDFVGDAKNGITSFLNRMAA